MHDGAHEVGAGAPDGLRGEEVVSLQLDAAVGADALVSRGGDDLGELLQNEPPRVLRDLGSEVLQDLAHAAADVDKGRGVAVGLQARDEPLARRVHVRPARAVLPERVDVEMKSLKHVWVLDQPAKGRLVVVCKLERPVQGVFWILELGVPEILWQLGEGCLIDLEAGFVVLVLISMAVGDEQRLETYLKTIPAAYSSFASSLVKLLGTYKFGPCSPSMPIETRARPIRFTRVGEAPVAAARSSLDLGRLLFSTAVSKIFKSTAIRAAAVRVG